MFWAVLRAFRSDLLALEPSLNQGPVLESWGLGIPGGTFMKDYGSLQGLEGDYLRSYAPKELRLLGDGRLQLRIGPRSLLKPVANHRTLCLDARGTS